MAVSLEDLLDPVPPFPPERGAAIKARTMTRLVAERRRSRVRRGAAMTTCVATIAGAAVFMALKPSQPAVAAWAAVPRTTSIALDDPMIQRCLTEISQLPSPGATAGWAVVPVLAEARSESGAALLTGADRQGICIDATTSRTGAVTEAPALGRRQDLSLAGNGGSVDDPAGIRYVSGRTSPRVATVTVRTAGRLEVKSSVSDGAFMAWWPGSDAPVEVVASDAAGTVVATLEPRTE